MTVDHTESQGRDRSLHGRRIWITGASSGIGRAIAQDLSADGATVILTARSEPTVEEVGRSCKGSPPMLLPGSVADVGAVERMADRIRQDLGGIDALVHCAGISPDFHSAESLDSSVWDEVIQTNLTGTFLVCKAAFSLMGPGGSMVTFSSIHANSASARLAAYSASKAGVEALTRAMAADWAPHGIRVNCVAPGYFETAMTGDLMSNSRHLERLEARIPMGRLGVPEELTFFVRAMLVGGEYMTGAVVPIDGGWLVH